MKHFGVIPYQKIRDLGLAGKLDAGDVVLLDHISGWAAYGKSLRHPDNGKLAWFDYQTYLDENPITTYKTKRTLIARIKKLRDLKLIETVRDKHGRLYAAPLVNLFGKEIEGGAGENISPGRGKNFTGPVKKFHRELEVKTLGEDDGTPPTPPSGASAPSLTDDLTASGKGKTKPQTFLHGKPLAYWENHHSLPPTGTDEERLGRIEEANRLSGERAKAEAAKFLQENTPRETKNTRRGRGANMEAEDVDLSDVV